MKKLVVFFAFVSFLTACQKKNHPIISMPTEKYRLLTKSTEDLVELKSQWKKSKIEIEMDFKTGEFKGLYKKIAFTGKFDILKVSSGFVKGFNYRVELAFLSKDASEADTKLDAFFQTLSKCRSIFVSPDRLVDNQYVIADFKTDVESEKITFLLFK